jgi:hypothetical protein
MCEHVHVVYLEKKKKEFSIFYVRVCCWLYVEAFFSHFDNGCFW